MQGQTMVQLHKTKNLVEHMIKHSVLNIENIGKSTFIPLHDQSREEIDIGNKTNENTRVYFLHKEEQQLRKRTSHFATSYYFSVKIDSKLKEKKFPSYSFEILGTSIAHWKGIRSCIKYFMFKFVSNGHLSLSFAFSIS